MSTEILIVRRDPRVPEFAPQLPGDVGFDLAMYSPDVDEMVLNPHEFSNVPTGLDVKMGDNSWGMIRARSSTIYKHGLFVLEGTIDPGYTGPLFMAVYNPNHLPFVVKTGERLAQLVPIPRFEHVEVKYVKELPKTARGVRGFGSTGR